MDRVNISIPDEMHRQAKEAGLNISQLARDAIAGELDRLAKIAAAKDYLAELEAELGPISPEERARAEAWADRVFGSIPEGRRRTA